MSRSPVEGVDILKRQTLSPGGSRQFFQPEAAARCYVEMKAHRRKGIPGKIPVGCRLGLVLSCQRIAMRKVYPKNAAAGDSIVPVLPVAGSREPDGVGMDRGKGDGLIAERQ